MTEPATNDPYQVGSTPYPGPPATQQYGQLTPGQGPIGKVRSTGLAILLTVVTFGIYAAYWYFCVHDEMKRHRGTGLGGVVALLLALFVGIVSPYLASSEVGELYASRGQAKPVSGATGLWYFPGVFLVVGPIVWFVKTNGALNAYWRSLGAV
jgi:Domain of unknown function (DUF4234)